jgi:hypothetical protein
MRTLDGHYCNFKGHGNWLVIRAIDDQGLEVDYEIYFQLRRHGGHTLRMVVESAYVRASDTPGPGVPYERKGRVPFHFMAAKVFRGEPLRDPGHHRR